ncbi:MAG: M56 family metallopeptidase [Victivallaceae bacterium]
MQLSSLRFRAFWILAFLLMLMPAALFAPVDKRPAIKVSTTIFEAPANIMPMPEASVTTIPIFEAATVDMEMPIPEPKAKPISKWVYVAALYATGVLLLLAFRLAAWIYWRRKIKRLSLIVEPTVLDAFTKLNPPQRVKLVDGYGVFDCPASFGILHSKVIFPAEDAARFTSIQIGMMLLHELEHIRHGDPLRGLMMMIISDLFWFNPFVRWFARRFAILRELACDRSVMRKLPAAGAESYAKLIFEYQLRQKNRPPVLCPGLSAHSGQTKTRIMELMMNRKRRIYVLAAAMIFTVVAVIALPAWKAEAAEQKNAETPANTPEPRFDSSTPETLEKSGMRIINSIKDDEKLAEFLCTMTAMARLHKDSETQWINGKSVNDIMAEAATLTGDSKAGFDEYLALEKKRDLKKLVARTRLAADPQKLEDIRKKRKACAENLKRLAQTVITFANEHNGALPVLSDKIQYAKLNIMCNGDLAKMLHCPAAADGVNYIFFANGINMDSVADQSTFPMFMDIPEAHNDFVNVVFLDGHCSLIRSESATVAAIVEGIIAEQNLSDDDAKLLRERAAAIDKARQHPVRITTISTTYATAADDPDSPTAMAAAVATEVQRNLNDTAKGSPPPAQAITKASPNIVHVQTDRMSLFDPSKMNQEEIRSKLEDIKKNSPNFLVVINPNAHCSTQTITQTIEIAREVGVEILVMVGSENQAYDKAHDVPRFDVSSEDAFGNSLMNIVNSIKDDAQLARFMCTMAALEVLHDDDTPKSRKKWLDGKSVADIMAEAAALTGDRKTRFDEYYAKNKKEINAKKIAEMRQMADPDNRAEKLSKSIKEAKDLGCKSKLRQLGRVALLSSQSHDGTLPILSDKAQYDELDTRCNGNLAELLHCPAAPENVNYILFAEGIRPESIENPSIFPMFMDAPDTHLDGVNVVYLDGVIGKIKGKFTSVSQVIDAIIKEKNVPEDTAKLLRERAKTVDAAAVETQNTLNAWKKARPNINATTESKAIFLSKSGNYQIDGKNMNADQVQATLNHIYKQTPNCTINIVPDNGCSYDLVVLAAKMAKEVGFSDVRMEIRNSEKAPGSGDNTKMVTDSATR